MTNKLYRWILLLVFLVIPAGAQVSSNATRLRNRLICNPFAPTNGQVLTWSTSTLCWGAAAAGGASLPALSDNGTVVTSTEPILAPSGTFSNPGFAFSATPSLGLYLVDNLTIGTNNIRAAGSVSTFGYKSLGNCLSIASPAVCATSAAGSVAIPATATTLVVNDASVTANSQILLTFDSSLGTRLSVTCNTTQPPALGISARTAGVSFTITATASTTSPACLSFFIID